MKISGNILKMESKYIDATTPVEYTLPIGSEKLALNPLIGSHISFHFDGVINCIATGEKIKKSYNQGYSYKAFLKLAACDICIVRPELCHYHKGTCREPKWGEQHCMIPHVVYLAQSSHVKVGITRHSQIPYRWIDQGATRALPILKVPNRYISGLVEREIAQYLPDRTNWRKMLLGECDEEQDLSRMRESIYLQHGDFLDQVGAEDVDDPPCEITYPILQLPKRINSLSFDKTPKIEGTLFGIKGQYLIFDTGVVNMRKHQGYHLEILKVS